MMRPGRALCLSRVMHFSIVSLLLSPACAACGASIGSNALWCGTCWQRTQDKAELFRDALGFLLPYEKEERAWIALLRERRSLKMQEALLRLLLRKERPLEGEFVMVTAPQSGPDDAPSGLELLAASWARALGVCFLPGLFRKTEPRRQHDKKAVERYDFAPYIELSPGVRIDGGMRFLVLDDVCTTGSTLQLCEWRLRQAGAGQVQGFSLCYRDSLDSFSA